MLSGRAFLHQISVRTDLALVIMWWKSMPILYKMHEKCSASGLQETAVTHQKRKTCRIQ